MFGDPLGGLLFGGETLDYFCFTIGPENIDHPAKSGITFSRHESGSVFGHLANMRLRRAGSSRIRDRPQPAVDGIRGPGESRARVGLAVQPSPFGLTLGSVTPRRGGCIAFSAAFFPLLRFTHPEQLVIPAELGQLPYEARAACCSRCPGSKSDAL